MESNLVLDGNGRLRETKHEPGFPPLSAFSEAHQGTRATSSSWFWHPNPVDRDTVLAAIAAASAGIACHVTADGLC